MNYKRTERIGSEIRLQQKRETVNRKMKEQDRAYYLPATCTANSSGPSVVYRFLFRLARSRPSSGERKRYIGFL